jgi:hypothetical protein
MLRRWNGGGGVGVGRLRSRVGIRKGLRRRRWRRWNNCSKNKRELAHE